MCDAMSLLSAYGSWQSGKAAAYTAQANAISSVAEGVMAKSAGRMAQSGKQFEASQLLTLNVLETAAVRRDQGNMLKSFAEQAKQNAAAMAVSGLDPTSFEAITEGNADALREATGQKEGDLKLSKSSRKGAAKIKRIEGRMARMGGNLEATRSMVQAAGYRAEAQAAKFSGMMGAISTLAGAEQSYQQNNTGGSRFDYFLKSVGMGG